MKIRSGVLFLAIVLSWAAAASLPAAAPELAKLDIAAINTMRLRTEGSTLFMDVNLLLKNGSEQDIKLKNMTFKVKFRGKDGLVNFGSAPVDELIIPGLASGSSTPGTYTTTLQVKIGPKGEDTFERLLTLFNIVGDPMAPLVMILEGAGEVGQKVDKGWIYQKGLKAELEFSPTIQREVLFK